MKNVFLLFASIVLLISCKNGKENPDNGNPVNDSGSAATAVLCCTLAAVGGRVETEVELSQYYNEFGKQRITSSQKIFRLEWRKFAIARIRCFLNSL